MLTTLVIVLLWLSFSGFIYFITRHKKISLSFPQILVFFGCKIIAGGLYGYIFKRYYNGDDTWGLHQDSLLQYKRLLQWPAVFFSDIFSSMPVPATGEYYFQSASYLENLEYCLITKTLALFNLFSHGNYYVNVVFLNFLGFWGIFFFYRLISENLPPQKRVVAATLLFLFPPAAFWLSGIRTEAFLFLTTAILLYQFNQWLHKRRLANALACIACFCLGIVLRNGFTLVLVPALVAWWITVFFACRPLKTFVLTYAVCIAAVTAAGLLLPEKFSLLHRISLRQHEFLALKGNTRFSLLPLNGSPLRFLQVLPQAVMNTALRPFLWEARGVLQWFAAAENLAVLSLAGGSFFVWRRSRQVFKQKTLFLLLLLAGISNYLVIGYIVPFPGAIVRYKIIPELFVIGACITVIGNSRGLFRSTGYTTTASEQI